MSFELCAPIYHPSLFSYPFLKAEARSLMLTLSTQPDFEFSLVGGMSLGAPEVSG